MNPMLGAMLLTFPLRIWRSVKFEAITYTWYATVLDTYFWMCQFLSLTMESTKDPVAS